VFHVQCVLKMQANFDLLYLPDAVLFDNFSVDIMSRVSKTVCKFNFQHTFIRSFILTIFAFI